MLRSQQRWSWLRNLTTLWLVCALWACGGSGGVDVLTTREVSNAVASARNMAEMGQAFGNLYTLLAFQDGDLRRDAYSQFEEFQLNSNNIPGATLETVYNQVQDRLAADPRTARYASGMTVQEFVDLVNARLPAAYASPNSPANAPYVLLSSRPGAVPISAPTMSPNDRLTVFQTMMLCEVSGRIWVENNPVPLPDPILDPKAPAGGLVPGDFEDCKAACEADFQQCGDACAAQLRADLAAIAADFRAEVTPVLMMVVVVAEMAQVVYTLSTEACRGDQACIDNINQVFNETIHAVTSMLEEAMLNANLGYANRVSQAQDGFRNCEQGCSQTLATCIAGCHNQGGG